jgi:hypothetical protein
MDNSIEINSIEEFLQHGGEKQHYLGKAMYCWQDLAFPNDWDGRVPNSIIRTFFKCAEHPIVVREKARIEELRKTFEYLRLEIRKQEIALSLFIHGKESQWATES